MNHWVNVEPNVNIYIQDLNPTGRKTILFLHGWPLCHKSYEYQFDKLPNMGYRCIGMDLRGFGYSDKPAEGYSYDRMADDVKGVIDLLKLNDITLAGHSMGGAISIRYMARHKGYGVSKLALFGAAAPSFTKLPNFPYGMTKQQVTQFVNETYQDRPKMLQQFGDMFFFQYITQALSDWFFDLGLQAGGWSTALSLISLRDETLFSDLGKITIPTLIIHGVHDRICPFPLGVAQSQGIKNSKLVPFYFSGHGTFYDEPDKFNSELSQFVG